MPYASAQTIDRVIEVRPTWTTQRARCRMRVWPLSRIVVVTDLDDGPSVTNSIEAIGTEVERLLGVDLLDRAEDRWRLIEHYRANSIHGPTLDVVNFAGREDGRLYMGGWRRLDPHVSDWLYQAVAE